MARTIGLPQEIYLQVMRLADLSGLSIVDLVSKLVKAEALSRRLPLELPCWRVKSDEQAVIFECADAGIHRRWSLETARQAADTLEGLSVQPPASKPSSTLVVADLLFERRGPGVRIRCSLTGASRMMARCVAVELAALLRHAADVSAI
ncbi:hypothetical protein NGM99_01070 [Mesorhizobium sp. RP14(2022)]|uniref:F-box domain-containing protein n=1 Tax=Mesorhizobium liriopis TaxID=2953882 RepID=A0ABT1C2B5_9HYPH|nr:hypothetical protein [Mesorhizobium liriopis]MCO6048380.1 hypothetical protein [Mesorhizobium liriopis]